MTYVKRRKAWKLSRAHSYSHSRAHSPTFLSHQPRHSTFSNPSVALSMSQFILQPFRCFTNVTAHSQSSFSNLSVTSSTSQLILQPFRRFTYVTAHSPTLPFLHLRHSSFSNPSFDSPTSKALRLIHLASLPCHKRFCLETKIARKFHHIHWFTLPVCRPICIARGRKRLSAAYLKFG